MAIFGSATSQFPIRAVLRRRGGARHALNDSQ
jgi:hypothetical protein